MARFKDMVRVARVVSRLLGWRALLAASALFKVDVGAEHGAEERMPAVFAPEVLLPVQYYEVLRRKHVLEREKLLMFAVLEDAVETFMKYADSTTLRGQRLFREADEWINYQKDPSWPFSFDNICQFLDIEPNYMRGGLRRWKEAKLKGCGQVSASASNEAAHP